MLPGASRSTPSSSGNPGSGPTKPIASRTSSAGRVASVPSIGSKDGAPLLRTQWISSTGPFAVRARDAVRARITAADDDHVLAGGSERRLGGSRDGAVATVEVLHREM